MNSGSLYKNIQFFTMQGDDDGAGGQTNVHEVLVLETKTSFSQVRSQKTSDALQLRLDDRYIFTIRKRSGFTPLLNYLVEVDGIRYSITSVETDKVRHTIIVSKYGGS